MRSGRAEGKREGLAEGKREGQAEGGARILLGVLNARFGAVPAEAKARVLAATEVGEAAAAALQLVREGYVKRREGRVTVAVPLFREWIMETKGAE